MSEIAQAETVFIPIEKLYEPYYNPRKHPEKQVYNLSLSLKEFGQRRTISVWPDGKGKFEVLAGNGIKKAAELAKLPGLNCTLAPAEWPEIRRKAYAQADNQGGYEDDQLAIANILQEILDDGDIPLEALGSSQDDLDALLAMLAGDALGDMPQPGDGGDEFDTSVEEGPTRSKLGDLWQLGKHRLLVGDCTDAGDVARLMGGEKAGMVWTDPPYGVSYVGKTKDALTIQNDSLDDEGLDRLLRQSLGLALDYCEEGGAWYVAAPPGPLHYVFFRYLIESGIYRQTIIWVKNSLVLGHSDYHYRHEPVFYGWKPGASHYFTSDRSQDSIWEIDRPSRSTDHPTMKPIALIEKAIANSSVVGALVYDPFLGSGTTLIAAQRTNRRCFGMEISEKYADVVIRRFEAETGETAKLLERAGQPELLNSMCE